MVSPPASGSWVCPDLLRAAPHQDGNQPRLSSANLSTKVKIIPKMNSQTPSVNKTSVHQISPSGGDLEGAGLLLSLSSQIAQKQPEAIALLNQVYLELFNQTIQHGCGNCYQKAFFRIQKYLYLQQQQHPLNNNTMQVNRKYLLKPDRSLQTSFGGDTLTNDNLTDEAAEKLLKAHPTLIKHFDRYPDAELPVTGSGLPLASPQSAEVSLTKKENRLKVSRSKTDNRQHTTRTHNNPLTNNPTTKCVY